MKIRTFWLAVALVFCGTRAEAQLGFPGEAPFTFNAPAAAAGVGLNDGDAGTPNCYWDAKGRSGGQYQCPSISVSPKPAPAPGKK